MMNVVLADLQQVYIFINNTFIEVAHYLILHDYIKKKTYLPALYFLLSMSSNLGSVKNSIREVNGNVRHQIRRSLDL